MFDAVTRKLLQIIVLAATLSCQNSQAGQSSGDASVNKSYFSLEGTTQQGHASRSLYQDDMVGLGARFAKSGDVRPTAFVLEGQHHFKQRELYFAWPQYGQTESRLEVGRGFGVEMTSMTGFTIYGVNQSRKISPHLGVEITNGRIAYHHKGIENGTGESFYEWLPMSSIGLQAELGSCRLLPLMRGGGAVGNLGKSGIRPHLAAAAGAGVYLNCRAFDLALERTRIYTAAQQDLALADMAFNLPIRSWKLGFRGEAVSLQDQRVLVFFRSPVQ